MTALQSLRLYKLTLEFIPDREKAKEYVSKNLLKKKRF